MIQLVKAGLMACGAAVFALYMLGTLGIGEFAMYYGKPGHIAHACMERT
jgi:hypothetical protein